MIGAIVGRVLDRVLGEVLRGGDGLLGRIASAIRDVAEEVERGDIVSDEALDRLQRSVDAARRVRSRGRAP